MNNNSGKLDLIRANLVKTAVLYQKKLDDREMSALVAMYNSALEEIPISWINEVFNKTFEKCKIFPKPANLLEVWKDVQLKVPEKQEKIEEKRPSYLTDQERETLQRVRRKYPQFRELLDELDIENDPNGYAPEGWWKRFNKIAFG